ncbi:class II fructose-bisphosphate aldolase [Lactobacillus corticis]|uniref:Fructose/tagatose bisphosphate aldolase n=1 Tax=Lactobacillus corticis TaxID=2201249 RepID=A0A916VI68_9LACO|nr:class II fructose-bisphosphate aldolase [Lactobacillus corticis]GFZ27437.1 fructose/tagatose bisphosphate aldolase [Lactobacillus corticis]
MVLANLNDVLPKAKKDGYAVGAFNYADLNTARGIVKAAETEKAPVVLQIAESHFPYLPLDIGGKIALDLAKQSSVPVVVHLDHGTDIKTCMIALQMGFKSVMIDQSLKPLDENIAATKKVVEVAHMLGATVEGEVGVMTTDVGKGKADYSNLSDNYTTVEDAKRFYEETGVDAVAISYGTVHGIYREKLSLNFERLYEISEALPIPLVVHGGSGLSDEEYHKSISNGISKVNYYSTMSYNVTNGLRNYLNEQKDKQTFLFNADLKIMELVQKDISEKIRIFGSNNRV